MTREQKLEAALRAATRLRRAIEPEPSRVPVRALLVPVEAVRAYDLEIERLAQEGA